MVQYRPRLSGNNHLNYGVWGYSEAQMKQFWLPGRVVEFPSPFKKFINQAYRASHPEDRLFDNLRMTNEMLTRFQVKQLIQPLVYDSVHELFPQVVLQSPRRSASISAGTSNERSVGYVKVSRLVRDSDDMDYVFVTDMQGHQWRSKIKGVHLFGETHDGYASFKTGFDLSGEFIVRFALSGEYHDAYWVMLSDIFW